MGELHVWKGSCPITYTRFRGTNVIDVLRSAAAWIAENHVTDVLDFTLRDFSGNGEYEAMLYYTVSEVDEKEETGDQSS